MKSLSLILLASVASAQPVAPYHQKADKIVHILRKEGAKPDREAIAMTLREIDVNLKKYFPNGEFTRHDFYAIAMLESRFNPKCIGTSGEKGIFQIMPSWYKGKNVASPSINTELAFKVMKTKHRIFKDKRRTIIGYNGWVLRNGKVRDIYYRAVMKQKRRIQHV